MTTPPTVTAEQVAEAINNIASRRADIDDPNRAELGEGPADTLAYLRKYGSRTGGEPVPAWVREADVKDGLLLNLWLWWEYVATEVWLLDRAEDLGMPGREVGRVLGITTRQGVVDRRDRRRVMLGSQRTANEKVARDDRAERRKAASVADLQQDWLDDHRGSVQSVAQVLVDHGALADDDTYEWLLEVKRDLRDEACTPSAFTQIRLAAESFEAVSEVAVLPAEHPLRTALRGWHVLDAEYRKLSGMGEPRLTLPRQKTSRRVNESPV